MVTSVVCITFSAQVPFLTDMICTCLLFIYIFLMFISLLTFFLTANMLIQAVMIGVGGGRGYSRMLHSGMPTRNVNNIKSE